MPSNDAAYQNYPPVNVAILLPLSGQHEKLGQAMLNAAQMALFDIGYPNFKLIPRDTKGTPDGAREAVKSAINDRAELILGPVFSSSMRAVKPLAARAGINVIGFTTDWTMAGGNAYTMGFLPFDQLERVTAYAARKGVRRVGVLTPNNNYGQIVSSNFTKLAPQYGLNITRSMHFQSHSGNLAPTVRQFSQRTGQSIPYDAVLMPTGGEDARAIASLLSHNNLPPRRVIRIGTGLLDDPALATERNLEGAWFAAPAPNARSNFEERYYRTFSTQPPRLSTLAYDAAALAITLARQGFEQGGRSPAYNRAALTNPNGFAGIDGIFRFRSDGTSERGLAVLSFQNGRIVVLENAPQTFQNVAR